MRALTATIAKSGLKKRDQWLVSVGSLLLTTAVAVAMVRWLGGYSRPTPSVGEMALIVHLVTVIPAIPLGAYLLLFPKGTARHRLLGKIWLMLMLVTATSTLFLRNVNDGSFSFIHLFVLLTFWSAPKVYLHARRGDMKAHRDEVLGLFVGALLVAGALTFLPGRLMWVWLVG